MRDKETEIERGRDEHTCVFVTVIPFRNYFAHTKLETSLLILELSRRVLFVVSLSRKVIPLLRQNPSQHIN